MDGKLPEANSPELILSAFSLASRQKGATVFLVDNLMTAEVSILNERDYYRAQSTFVGKLVTFCKAKGAHVHMVAHPRKNDGGRIKDADEVGGSGEITNRADNAFTLARLPEEDAEREGYSSLLTVLKNREFGNRSKIALLFDEPSRRFSGRMVDAINHRMPWYTAFTEVSSTEQTPF